MAKVKVRKGMPSVQLTKAAFAARVRERFYDPVFAGVGDDIDRVIEAAWDGYDAYRKSPRTRRAGPGFADPEFELPKEWLETRRRIRAAERAQRKPGAPARILLINGSARTDQSCPGEMSKSYRLVSLARDVLRRQRRVEVEVLDLSRLTSEYGRVIHPCKACVSTAMPLCHWPCSCYPNHAMGQVNDWMAEIYPKWVAAHGVMIVCPVNWYQAPSTLKLMIDRLVCADGGNPDPTSTGGKDPARAKALELAGWPYPRHLAGRVFSLVVHGDTAGVETLRRSLADWLSDMGLIAAGRKALVESYIGYYRPYATSHDDLDADAALRSEVASAARSLLEAVRLQRRGKFRRPDDGEPEPRPK
ncbi:MAG: flavodoxin family protein [Alphaproteobacteria bacterium]|nr:flavodoxin family protein [Alphaproteobacteria bacterium]